MSENFIELSEVLSSLDSDYFSHHGILGQKWGIRRFQNKDGSLTSAGKARANRREKVSIKDMSDAELQAKLDRARLENQYRDQLRYANRGRRFLEGSSKDLKTVRVLSVSVVALGKLGAKVLSDHPEIVNTTLKLFKK